MLADPLQHIDQISVRIDLMQSARHQQALHDAHVLGPQSGPTKHPVLPSHRNHAQRSLQMVGIDGHVRIDEEHFQGRAPLARIGQRFGERQAGHQVRSSQLSFDPCEERFNVGATVRGPVVAFVLARELLATDGFFDGVQGADTCQRRVGALGIALARVKEVATRVCPALGVGDAHLFAVGGIGRVAIAEQQHLTTVDRFGLVRRVDGTPTFRMLQVSELRKAMGYPDGAKPNRGSRRDKVKLLGNGVCPPVMEAVVRSLTS